MPSILANAKNFLLSSDYPPEKVAYKYTNSYSVIAAPSHSDAVTITVAHGLGFTPLCRGSFRFTNSSGTQEWSSFDMGVHLGQAALGTDEAWFPAIQTAIYSDETNIYMYIWNQTGLLCNVDVRVIGFMDAVAVDTSIQGTGGIGSGLVFDTDNNYLKIIDSNSGIINTSIGTQVITVNHGLGYSPVAFVWVYSPDTMVWGAVGTENYRGITSFDSNAVINNSNLTITINYYGAVALGDNKYAYRIFADE